MDKYAELRAALDAVPCVKWTASRSTVHIPETDDWAGKDMHITGLDKQVARKLARYIADTHPEAVRALLAERDAYQDALYAIEGLYDYDMPVGEAATALYEASNIARAALAQEQEKA